MFWTWGSFLQISCNLDILPPFFKEWTLIQQGTLDLQFLTFSGILCLDEIELMSLQAIVTRATEQGVPS